MKRTLIALGIAATVALPVAAQAAPKVYGRLNVSVEEYKKDYDHPIAVQNSPTAASRSDLDYSRLVSNASRFGVKGEDELTASLSAVYLIEWGVSGDGDSTDLGQRNRYIGIKSNDFGTLKLGKYDTYLKQAQGEIDLFNDLEGDFQFVIAGENRINNVIGYESPKFLDALTFNVLAQTQDSNNTTANLGTASTAGQSASVVYNSEELGLYAALAYDNNITGATALYGTRSSDQFRLVGSYKITDLTLNAVYSSSKAAVVAAGANDNKETGWQLGASYKIGDELIKVQYGVADGDNAAFNVQKHTQWSVGADHNFTSKTRAYFFYTQKEEEQIETATNSAYSAKIAGLGLDHKF